MEPAQRRRDPQRSEDHAVVANDVTRCSAEVVREETGAGSPREPPGRVPAEEAPPVHARCARDPGAGHAKPRNEPSEEDRLPPVAREKALGAGEEPLGVARQKRPATEEAAASPATNPVAGAVAGDRRRCRDDDDEADPELAPRGEQAGRDERGLAGNRCASRFEENEEEEQHRTIRLDQVLHDSSSLDCEVVGAMQVPPPKVHEMALR